MANTIEGKTISAKNATKHGCCADSILILPTESMEDYRTLENIWTVAYTPICDAERHLVQELIIADWFLQRATRTVADIEAQLLIETPNPLNWIDQQHKTFNRFLRYQTTRSNTVNRCRKALEDFIAKREAEMEKSERNQARAEKNKPEPTISEIINEMMEQKHAKERRKQEQQQQQAQEAEQNQR